MASLRTHKQRRKELHYSISSRERIQHDKNQSTMTAPGQALAEQDARIDHQISILEQIVSDKSVGIVQLSKAKVELAQLRRQHSGSSTDSNGDRRGKLSSRPSVRGLGAVGLVTKNTVINEYFIKQNEERLHREEEILLIQKELQDETQIRIRTAEETQLLERRLTVAKEAMEEMANVVAFDEAAEEDDDDDSSTALETPLGSMVIGEVEDSELIKLREQIALLQQEVEEQELTIEGLNILLEDHEKENDVKARELKDTEKLMRHYKSKTQELDNEVEALKSEQEDVQAIENLPLPQTPRQISTASRRSTASRPSIGGRRSSLASINPSFRAALHRAATKGNINDEMREEAKVEMKALQDQLASMDTEKADLLEELATMRAILESSSKDNNNNNKKAKKKRERLVYQLGCKKCNKLPPCVGTTDRDLRTTMEKHFDAVVELACKKKSKGDIAAEEEDEEETGKASETWTADFAKHFAKHCKPALKIKSVSEKECRTFCRQNVKVEVLKRSDGSELYWEDTE